MSPTSDDTKYFWHKYSESPLSPWLKKHLKSVNIQRPSPIQLQLIHAIMTRDGKRIKRNVFGCSPTGTGKTLAYVLPILHFLTQDIRPYYALILAPTKELAYQIYQIIRVLTGSNAKDNSATMIKTLLMIGGKTGLQTSETELQGFWSGKPNIVVSTPGRMEEQITRQNHLEHTGHRSALRFDFLVLDEADLIIGPTFANQLKNILNAIDEHGGLNMNHRQTLVLSATLTSALEKLQKLFSSDDIDKSLKPRVINLLPSMDEVKQNIVSNPNLDQRYVLCPEPMKPAYLIQALSDISFKQVIVFCNSARQATLLHKLMLNLGFDDEEVKCHPVLLIGNKEVKERLKALESFKSLKSRIMIATGGLAGRGLDLPQVDLVIQYNCPTNPVDYIHRVGRTCRQIDFSKIDNPKNIAPQIHKKLKTKKKISSKDQSSSEQEEENNKEEGHISPSKSNICDNDDEVTTKKDREFQNEAPPCKRAKLSKAASRFYGKAIIFITQYDIQLLKNIETFINIKLTEEDEIDQDKVRDVLKPVAIGLKDAELSLAADSR